MMMIKNYTSVDPKYSLKSRHSSPLLSEFGNVYDSIDKSWRQSSVGQHHAASHSTLSFFEALLKKLKLDDIAVHALAPYVAL